MDLQLNLNTKPKLGCKYTGATEFMVCHVARSPHSTNYSNNIRFHCSWAQ